ncbi:hypothetical protein QE152_g5229 [Popillia japonica]|uniref:Uncharacterized protein n=1 Tax=Popillia japonica TaxID=7064 RepID=A0AAW1MLV9_POPJA
MLCTIWLQLQQIVVAVQLYWNSPDNIPVKPVSDIPPTLQNVTEINEYFLDNIPVSTSDPELLTFYRTHRLNPNSEKFNFVPIQESELINIISEIKTKASGYDPLTKLKVKLLATTH